MRVLMEEMRVVDASVPVADMQQVRNKCLDNLAFLSHMYRYLSGTPHVNSTGALAIVKIDMLTLTCNEMEEVKRCG
jgi:hypothetical protein